MLNRSAFYAEKLGMRGLHTVLLMGVCLLGTGCFVIDEIDKGTAMMDYHSSAPKQATAEAGAARKGGAGGLTLAGLRERGADAFSDLSGRVEQALKKAPDPENIVVSCRIEGRPEFARKFDCQSRGGRVLPR